MDLMKALTSQYMKQELPEVQVGDTVRVHVKIKEGSRERIQVFEGTIIAKKHGGIEETITVRRISYGVGCEKVFPVHAPNVVNVETVRHGKVRRAKLYYLRDRMGKAAKVKDISCLEDCYSLIQIDAWDNPLDTEKIPELQDIGIIVNYNSTYEPPEETTEE